MGDLVDRLNAIADAATDGPWEHVPPIPDGTFHKVRQEGAPRGHHLARMADTGYSERSSWRQRAADATHIATFDPPTVKALLAVIEAAQYRQGIDDTCWCTDTFDCGAHVVGEALARLEATVGSP